ncbi:hypothetical protein [Azospirillum sp.]|uniref:hypothetical protein n=1 Tax=Azospirillum sp. TaxID=34012 RepID=UPI0026265125|nr:hypothetical protein [Azospirillum sp.]
MTANFFGLFSQAGSLAKSNAETTAAKSARVAGLVQDGYRRWFDGVTASVNDAGRLAGEFGKVRSPADLAALHREWLNTTQARVTEGVQGFLDVSAKIAAEVAILPVSNVTVAVKSGPVLVKPVVVVAKTEAPAKVKAPVVEAPVVEVPAVEVPVVKAPVLEAAVEPPAPAPAPVVETVAVPAPVEAPIKAPVEAAPAVEVAPVAEAAPVDAAPVETVEAAAPEAPVAAKPPVKAGPQRRVGGRPAGRTSAQR